MSTSSTHRFEVAKELKGILFMVIGMFFALSLISYSPTDPALNAASNMQKIHNLCGVIGAFTADILLTIIGISAYLTTLLFFLLSLLHFFDRPISLHTRHLFFGAGFVVFLSSLFHLRFESIDIAGTFLSGGGIIGGFLGEVLIRYLNRTGAYVVASAGAVVFFSLTTRLTLQSIFLGIKKTVVWLATNFWKWCKTGPRHAPALIRSAFVWVFSTLQSIPAFIGKIKNWRQLREEEAENQKKKAIRIERPAKPKPHVEDASDDDEESDSKGPKILKRADAQQKRPVDAQLKLAKIGNESYVPPPISLLDAPEGKKIDIDEEALRKNSLLLEKKLMDFEVQGRVTAIHPGPVITMYEFEPSPGTKVNKVVNLEDDLSLALGGRSVRIIAHLPGKAALGIEVPNHERETVWLKNIIASSPFQKSSTKIPIALGTNTEGHPAVTDLTRMPHLLIAGATGAGKSVAINS
ncbi:MAG: DNA translocase FtsK 4TM domain-containing protein, partial [Deltaproteobacteria bacterium]|nr:DNA translocase FtsK 4TM domain-containing protein [Deltaproteobacteria bacterium]